MRVSRSLGIIRVPGLCNHPFTACLVKFLKMSKSKENFKISISKLPMTSFSVKSGSFAQDEPKVPGHKMSSTTFSCVVNETDVLPPLIDNSCRRVLNFCLSLYVRKKFNKNQDTNIYRPFSKNPILSSTGLECEGCRGTRPGNLQQLLPTPLLFPPTPSSRSFCVRAHACAETQGRLGGQFQGA